MKPLARLMFLAAACLALNSPSPAAAQPGAPRGGMGQPPGLNSALTHLFGKTEAFSAKARMQMLDARGNESMSAPIDFALLDGSTYWSMDLSLMKSAQIPPQAAASLKQMGMHQTVTISRAKAKNFLLVYPAAQAYVEMPLPAGEATDAQAVVKTESLGEETIDGRKCRKEKVLVTANGTTTEALRWLAADLQDFPIRLQFKDQGNTVQMDYSDIKLAKPDAKLFAAPAGFTKYDSLPALMQGIMMKSLGNQPGR